MSLPIVCGIELFPLKSFDAHRVEEAELLPSGGLAFDRRWAFRDAQGRFVNAKRFALLHCIRARFELARAEVELDGERFSLVREVTRIEAFVAERLGVQVSFHEAAANGFPDDTNASGPTLVSTASLVTVARWFGLSLEEVRRRFRVNIEIEGVEAFWEDRLYGRDFRIGGVALRAVNPCARCAVPTRDSLSGSTQSGFQRRFAELRKVNLPAWAKREDFSHFYRLAVNTRLVAGADKPLRVGDPVTAS